MEELQKQINELREEIAKLKSSTTIPYDVEQSFRTRLRIENFAELGTSSKTVASETQAVNEAGTDNYDVAKPPVGFREFVSGGSVFYIPYYNL